MESFFSSKTAASSVGIFTFLKLPLEIRYMIYRQLRTVQSIKLEHPLTKAAMGYASFGLHPEILATNKQVSHEAKQIFYGENYWTLYAAHNLEVPAQAFKLVPLSSAVPYIRKVYIRFRMAIHVGGGKCLGDLDLKRSPFALRVSRLREICQVLHHSPCLQYVLIAWTETTDWPTSCFLKFLPKSRYYDRFVQAMSIGVAEMLQPLLGVCHKVRIERDDVWVRTASGTALTGMEIGFCTALDQLVAQRATLLQGPLQLSEMPAATSKTTTGFLNKSGRCRKCRTKIAH